MNAMNKKIVKCINEKDKEGLKKLFSKSAKMDIEDIDDQGRRAYTCIQRK